MAGLLVPHISMKMSLIRLQVHLVGLKWSTLPFRAIAGIGMNVLQVKTATELPGSGSVWKTAFGHSSLIRMAPECTMENIHLLGTLIQWMMVPAH